MRLSVFNLYVEDHPEPGCTLVYNTFTGGFVVLERAELGALRRLDAGEGEAVGVDPAYLDPAVGILVESREAEERAWRDFYEESRARVGLSVVVSVTFACNFACTYCCQEDVLDGKTMSHETARRTGAWVAERARAVGSPSIHLVFVGGEPLLHPGRIEEVLAEVRARTDVPVAFTLLTNGLFLTRELVERWVPLGLTAAKVTLDGDERTHSITRRSKRGEDTFATIFRNVIDASGLIHVIVNGNYQDDTTHGFVPLLEQLRAAGFPRGARIRFTPAVAGLGAPSDAASGSCTWSGSAPEVMLALSDEVRRAGYDPGDLMAIGPCALHWKHSFTVDPEGRVYKCPGFLGNPGWAIGDVAVGLDGRHQALDDELQRVQGGCQGCAHRPNCSGGCVAAEWINQGRAEGVGCEGGYFESQKDALVTRKYALASTDSVEEALALFPPLPTPSPIVRQLGLTKLRVLAA
jgi:uncharacterized protein